MLGMYLFIGNGAVALLPINKYIPNNFYQEVSFLLRY